MKKLYKTFLIIQVIVCVILIMLIFRIDTSGESIMFPSNISWIPLVCTGILFMGLIYEICIGNRPIVRFIYILFTTMLSIGMLVVSLSLTNACLIILGIPYCVMLVVTLIKNMPQTKSKIFVSKSLPDGILDKKEITVQYIFYGVLAVVAVICILVLNTFGINWTYVFILIPIALIFLFFVILKTNRLRRIYNIINNDLDYESFNEMIEEALKNNISFETYNYLLIVKANYLLAYDAKAGIDLFSEIKIPENKKYKLIYQTVDFEYSVIKGEYDLAQEKLSFLPENQKSTLKYYYTLYATKNEINNIETIYQTNKKMNFLNISSSFAKMYYYETRNEHELAVKNAKDVLAYKSNLNHYNSIALKVLNNEPIE